MPKIAASILLALSLAGSPAGAAATGAAEEALRRDAGAMLLVGFRGTDAGAPGIAELVCGLRVGGLLLFARDLPSSATVRNIESPDQLARLTRGLRALAAGCGAPAPLVAADVEGGAVNRLQARFGFPRISSHAVLGAGAPEGTRAQAERAGRLLAQAGIDWDLAPVVDLALEPGGPIIARWGRAFSDRPEAVAAHARAFIDGLDAYGIRNALKHFPGLGASREDPHHEFVDLTGRSRPELELEPYRLLIAAGVADAVVTAHTLDRALDPALPATLSSATLTGLLRGRLGFAGVIVTDDLQMDALIERYPLEQAAVLSVLAGADMVMISNNRDVYDPQASRRVRDALVAAERDGRLAPGRLAQSRARIERLRAGRRSDGTDYD